MSAKRIFFVLNPAAGEGNPQPVREAIDAHLDHHEIDLHETKEDEDITAVVADRLEDESYDWVIAAGGDGTVSLVANGVAEKDVPLGIVPLGTANGLASELDIPADIDDACRLLAEEPAVRQLDAMKVNDKYILLHLGLGLNTRLMKDTSRAEKNQLGVLAYLKSLMEKLGGYETQPLHVTIDGRTHQMEMTELMVTNAALVGIGELTWGEQVAPDDGRIDVCAIHLERVQDYATTLWNVLAGEQQENDNIQYFTAQDTVRIESQGEPVDVAADGEIMGHTPVEISVVASAVPVLVSAES